MQRSRGEIKKNMGTQRALVVLGTAAALTFGCGGSKNQDPYTPDRVASLSRGLKYHKVVIHPYTVDKGVEEPGAAPADCQKATVDFLNEKKVFASVQVSPDAAAGDADTLLVDVAVTSLRIVSGGARFWAGAFAGSSHMTLAVNAKDSAGASVGQQIVSNDNNAMGAAWSFGASDRGLPGDMGPLVADAVVQLAQAHPVAVAASPTK